MRFVVLFSYYNGSLYEKDNEELLEKNATETLCE